MPASIIRSVCIVCNVDFECESKTNEKNLPALFSKMWRVFNKYFNLSSSKWKDILHFYNQVFELPYCTNCRNDVAQLLIFHEKIEYNLLKIKKLTTNLSATIIQSSYKSHQKSNDGGGSSSSIGKENDLESLVQNDSQTSSIKKENDNNDDDDDEHSNSVDDNKPKIIVNEAVNSQIRLLRQQIVQNFEPQVVLSDFYTEKINEEMNVNNYSNSINSDLDCLIHDDEVPMNIVHLNYNINENFQDPDYNKNNNNNGDDEDDDDDNDKMDEMEEQSRTSTMTMENYCLVCDETFVDSCSLAAHSLLFHGINLEMNEVEEASKSSEKIVVEEGVEMEENVDGDSKSIPVVRLSENRFQYVNCNFEKNPNDETEYICKCGEKRSNMSSMLKHITAAHVGNKAVNLGYGQFSVKSSSTDHQWIFSSTPDGFKCGSCDKGTKLKKNMISHIKIHHMDMPAFSCTVEGCDMTFSSAFNCRRHISTVHLNIRPYHCDFCNGSNSFKSKKCLIRHLKNVHELSDSKVEAINRKHKRQKSSTSSSSSSMWTPNEVLVLEENQFELPVKGQEEENVEESLMTEMEMAYYDNSQFNNEFLTFSGNSSSKTELDVCDLDNNNYSVVNTYCDEKDPLALQCSSSSSSGDNNDNNTSEANKILYNQDTVMKMGDNFPIQFYKQMEY